MKRSRFYKYRGLVLFAILLIGVGKLGLYAMAPVTQDSLRFEVLLSSQMLNDLPLDINLIESQEMTANQLILLSTTDQFYLLGWGGIKPLGPKVAGAIRCFAYTPDGFLMIVRNRELCYIDSIGNLVKLLGLPDSGMGLHAGEKALYFYDQNSNKNKHALYILEQGGKYKELLAVPSPIHSVAEMNQSILFSSENSIFSFHPENKVLKALATLPKEHEIRSIAVDSSGKTLYFSTMSSIYTLIDSTIINLTNEFGGMLQLLEDGLLVFNPEKKFLTRILGMEQKIASEMQKLNAVSREQPSAPLLTNAMIIDLVKTKLSDGLIINLINRSQVDFNLNVDSMIYLSSQNVSSEIILAMKNAMKRKTSNESLNHTK